MSEKYVKSEPYPWPYNGDLRPENTALIVIDMQTDFCGKGGYIDLLGYDISLTRVCIEPIQQRARRRCAKAGFHIIHTREGHRPDLADLPANKRWRSRKFSTIAGIGDAGPVRPRAGPRRAGVGHHPRALPRCPAKRSSTSRAKARSAPPTST